MCEEQQVHSTPSSDLVRRWAGGQKRDKTVGLPGNDLVMDQVHWPAPNSAAEGSGSEGPPEIPFLKDQDDALLGSVPCEVRGPLSGSCWLPLLTFSPAREAPPLGTDQSW